MKSSIILSLLLLLASCVSEISSKNSDLETSSAEARKNVDPNSPAGRNLSPVVNAGNDILVKDQNNDGVEAVTFQGLAFDPQDNIIQYSIIENGITLSTGPSPSIFNQTMNFKIGTHNLIFLVKDATGFMGQDSIVVKVEAGAPTPTINTAPIVNAGPDMTIIDSDNNGSQVVKLQGSASDAENNIVKYYVHKNGQAYAGGTVPFIFVQELTLPVGVHTMTFEATDAGGLVGRDTVVITVKAPNINTAPVVNAGADITLVSDTTASSYNIKLSGSATDKENNISQYRIFVNGSLKLSGSTASTLTSTLAFAAGKNTVRMEAQDTGGLIGSDEVLVTVDAKANTAPKVTAGPAISVIDSDNSGAESVSLSASAIDDENNIATYRVLLNGVLKASGASKDIFLTTISIPVGSHSVTFEAIDSLGLKGMASTMITVSAAPAPPSTGKPPVANAGADIFKINTDPSGGVETLTVSGSAIAGSNPIVSYAWKNNGIVVQKGTTPTILTENKINFIKGNNLLTLEVTDSKGLVGVDNAIVEVRPSLNDNLVYGPDRVIIPGVLSISSGGQRIAIDRDGNGQETVRMVGSVNSINPITYYEWTWRGNILASGTTPDILTASLTLPLGQHNLWLKVIDSKGNTIKDAFNLAVTPPVIEQRAKIPSNFNIDDYLKPEWATGPSHWKDNSAFRFRCKASHFLYDDPIVFPGQPGKAHLHMFFGNTKANGNSTYESLRQTGDGSCDGGPLNRSAYWMPAVVNENGKVAVPDHITIYYKRHPGTNRIPRGLRMIFGFDHRYPDKKIKRWKCANGGGEFETIPEVNCPADQALMVTLGAPNCWDGKNLDSADHRSHMATGSYNQYGENVCPDTHPVNIPSFTMLISFSHSGFAEYSKWRLASDHVSPHDPNSAALPPGSTMHSDWFGAWDDDVMDMWHDGCMDQFKSCSGGALGMGKQLKENPGFSFKTIDRIIDAPVKPLP